jgi:peptide/nickel transport system substrate-binding protein
VRSRRSAIALVALAFAVALSLGIERAGGTSAPSGGTLTIASPLRGLSLDPALSINYGHSAVFYATCATLMAFRDAPAPAGYNVRPEAAVALPRILRDGRTYVFTVREGLRFSDGSPMTAGNYARALGRVLSPAMRSPGADLFSDVRWVSASGLRLRIELSRPSGDLTTRLALPFACPVPLGFPIDRAGVDLTVGSGPYYVGQDVPGKLLVLERNRYYRGSLPHRVSKIVVNFGGDLDSDIRAVEQGQADMLGSEIPADVREALARRYGVDRRQLFRLRGIFTVALVLNTSSPLFRDNVPLRKAVNLALDRPGVIATLGAPLSATPTDQVSPSRSPGWVDYHLYPLEGPDLERASRLAAGHLRGSTAVLYTSPDRLRPAMAAVIANNLAKIGLKVEVQQFSAAVMMAKVGTPGEPFDMVLGYWGDDLLGPFLPDLDAPILHPDPASTLVRYLGGQNARKPSGNANVAYFDVPAYNRRMAVASRLSGPPRFRAFSRLDADIMRNQAPWAPIAEASSWNFFSKRVGCFHYQPVIHVVLAGLCLR